MDKASQLDIDYIDREDKSILHVFVFYPIIPIETATLSIVKIVSVFFKQRKKCDHVTTQRRQQYNKVDINSVCN